MEKYLLLCTICLSILYLIYLVIYRNERNFFQLRTYLLLSVLVALIVPLNQFEINFLPSVTQNPSEQRIIENPEIPSLGPVTGQSHTFNPVYKNKTIQKPTIGSWFKYLKIVYGIIAVTLLLRIFYQVFILSIRYFTSQKIKRGNIILIQNSRNKNTFSFFNWIFLQSDSTTEKELEQIISHEKIHASQYHSFDLLMIELLAAVMWFNPLIWMMRNSIQLVHEYLADEGVLSTGIDRLRYQALLINQVTEEKLICLSSNFNHSLIKKRMIMMTKSKFHQRTKLKILALVPLTLILFLGISCINGQNKENTVTAIEPVRMNVLYIGADNPIKIAASGYKATELKVSIDNGTIEGKDGEYIVRPKTVGTANVIVSNSDGKEIQKTSFRVKNCPDPIAAVNTPTGLKTSGNITKKELLDSKGIKAYMKDFDFDLNFTVQSFVFSYTVPGKHIIVEEVSKSDQFTERQIDEIKSLVKWQKVTFEAITVTGPDGNKRVLSPMVFLITEE